MYTVKYLCTISLIHYVLVLAHCSLVTAHSLVRAALFIAIRDYSHGFLSVCLVFHLRPHRRKVRALVDRL